MSFPSANPISQKPSGQPVPRVCLCQSPLPMPGTPSGRTSKEPTSFLSHMAHIWTNTHIPSHSPFSEWSMVCPQPSSLPPLCPVQPPQSLKGSRQARLPVNHRQQRDPSDWSSWSRPRSWEVKAPVAASASKEIASQIPHFPLWACPQTAWEHVSPNRVSVTQGEISLGHLDILHLSFYLLHLGPSIKTSNLTTSYVFSVQEASPGQCSGSGQVQSPDGSME